MINAYCTDSIILVTRARGTWGSATETQVATRGRFEFRTKLVRNQTGETVVATAKIYIPYCALSHGDAVIYNAKRYSIIAIEEVKNFSRQFLKLDVA